MERAVRNAVRQMLDGAAAGVVYGYKMDQGTKQSICRQLVLEYPILKEH